MRHLARVTAAVITLVFVLLSASESRAGALYSVTDIGNSATRTITGLNDAGQVVGTVYSSPASGKGYAFVYDGTPAGTVTPLGGSLHPTNYPAVRDSFPWAINNSGQILATDPTGSVTGTPGKLLRVLEWSDDDLARQCCSPQRSRSGRWPCNP